MIVFETAMRRVHRMSVGGRAELREVFSVLSICAMM